MGPLVAFLPDVESENDGQVGGHKVGRRKSSLAVTAVQAQLLLVGEALPDDYGEPFR
jgi:hypothetical protein